jgi:hypothetical protein
MRLGVVGRAWPRPLAALAGVLCCTRRASALQVGVQDLACKLPKVWCGGVDVRVHGQRRVPVTCSNARNHVWLWTAGATARP